jgi:hypothetical protein
MVKSTLETTSALEMDQRRTSDTKHKSKENNNNKTTTGNDVVEVNSLYVTIPASSTDDIEAPKVVDAFAKNNDDDTARLQLKNRSSSLDQKKRKKDKHIKHQDYPLPINEESSVHLQDNKNDATSMDTKKRRILCFATMITFIIIVLAIAIPIGVLLKHGPDKSEEGETPFTTMTQSPTSQTNSTTTPPLSLECPKKCKSLLTGNPVTVNGREFQQAILDYLKDPLSSPYSSIINCWDVSQVRIQFSLTSLQCKLIVLLPHYMISTLAFFFKQSLLQVTNMSYAFSYKQYGVDNENVNTFPVFHIRETKQQQQQRDK